MADIKASLRGELNAIARVGAADRRTTLKRIVRAADKARALPTAAQLKKLDRSTRQFAHLMRDIVKRALRAEKLSDEELALLGRDVRRATLVARVMSTALIGGGGGAGAGQSCEDKYEDCIKNCEASEFSFCHVPCGIDYVNCVLSGSIAQGGLRVVAPRARQ